MYLSLFYLDSRNAALLWSLHAYLVPTQKKVQVDANGKKNVTKFTIKDSQESCIFFATTHQQVEDHITYKKSKSESVQPFLIVVGNNICEVEHIYLYFDGIKYIFKNFVRALDICFKIFYLFNLEYPIDSSFWQFIDAYFYNVNSGKFKNYTKVHIICDELNNLN